MDLNKISYEQIICHNNFAYLRQKKVTNKNKGVGKLDYVSSHGRQKKLTLKTLKF